MPLVLRFAARSDVGRVRSKNDDSAYAGLHLAVVADGMGGHVGGDVASASTVLDLAPLDATGYASPATVLPDEIQNANLILNDLVHASPKLAGMGTTCTALLLAGETIHVAHIGDSRAYRFKDDSFEQISIDHTFVQRLVDEGRLDPSEAESHPHKNVLMRVLGDVDASPELDITALDAAAGERWLLCSDGLTAVVPPPVIEQKMRHREDLQTVVDELVELTLAGGAPDNVTVVALEVREAGEQDVADRPTARLSDEALAAATPTQAGPVSASLLREDLESRPHVLVGAAELATQTGKIPIVTRRSTQKRAAALLTGAPVLGDQAQGPHPHHDPVPAGARPGATDPVDPVQTAEPTAPGADRDAEREADRFGDRPRRRRSVFIPVFTTLLALIFAVLLLWGYLWTQTQYFVGAHEGRVAIFNGVSQRLGPIELAHLDTETDVSLDELPTYSRQRVESGLPARDLEHAQSIVDQLENSLAPDSTPSPSPSSSGSASPSESSTSTSGPSPSSTSSPSPTSTATRSPSGGDR